jgi:antitoxin component HigA of HigAB toxin-antitoxin module
MNNESIKEKIIKSAIKNTDWKDKVKWELENQVWLDMSGRIAVKVLRYLRKEKITQKALAEQLGWSPQYLNKVLKGSENLTLETICKLQTATGLVLIEVPKFDYEMELV